MEDKRYDAIGSDWEDSIIREAILELGDPEGLRLFDEEQEKLERQAQEEIAEMEKQGMFLLDEE